MVELAEVLLTISTSVNRVRPSITTRSSSPLENGPRKSMYTVSRILWNLNRLQWWRSFGQMTDWQGRHFFIHST